MPAYTELSEIVADQVSDAFRLIDETGTAVFAGLVDSASRLLGTLPGRPEGSTAPRLEEVVTANLTVAERLVEAQHKLALDLLNAARPTTK